MDMKEYSKKILENIKKCCEQDSLTVDEWVSLTESFRDIGHDGQDSAFVLQVEQALMEANKRIKSRILDGSELLKMQKIENILGENRPTTPVISSSGTRGASTTIFINSRGRSDRYADSEITPVIDFDILEGTVQKDKIKIKLIEPTELTNATRKVQILVETEDMSSELKLGIFLQYVSPSGVKSERSNVIPLKVNFGYVGFIENISNDTSMRVGFNTSEDLIWLPKTAARLNEVSDNDPISSYLDNAKHLPFAHMKRVVLQCVRTPNSDGVYEVRYHPTLNLANMDDPKSEFIGFGDCDSLNHPKAKAFDSYTDQLVVPIVPHHEVDVVFRWNNTEYYLKCVKNTEFTVDLRDFGFENPEWVKGRGKASDNNNLVTSEAIDGFMMGAFCNIYQDKNSQQYEGSFAVNSKPRNKTALYNHRRDIEKYTGPGTDDSGQPLFRIQNYFERRTVVFLASIERGYVGNLAMDISRNSDWKYKTHITVDPWTEENFLSKSSNEPEKSLPQGNRVTADGEHNNNYRGLANLSGNYWEWIDGLHYNRDGTQCRLWVAPNTKPYSSVYDTTKPNPDHYENRWPDYVFARDNNMNTHTYIWGKQLYPGELFPDWSKGEGSATTGVTDYYWFHNGQDGYQNKFVPLIVSGSVHDSSNVGLFALYGCLSSDEHWGVGCRLVFRRYTEPAAGKVVATYRKGAMDRDS